MTRSLRILAGLAVLLAVAGWASAQNAECPECDADGVPGVNSSYSSVDLGVIDEDDLEAIADTDASLSDHRSETFFGWISICLSAFVDSIAGLVGLDLDLDANAEVYASEHGVDVDATVLSEGEEALDFDASALGDLDGATFEAMGGVRDATGLDVDGGVGGLVPDGLDVDACLEVDLAIVACE